MIEEQLCAFEFAAERLRARAAIRRNIPRSEPDRISEACEDGANAITELVAEVRRLADILPAGGSHETTRSDPGTQHAVLRTERPDPSVS